MWGRWGTVAREEGSRGGVGGVANRVEEPTWSPSREPPPPPAAWLLPRGRHRVSGPSYTPPPPAPLRRAGVRSLARSLARSLTRSVHPSVCPSGSPCLYSLPLLDAAVSSGPAARAVRIRSQMNRRLSYSWMTILDRKDAGISKIS